jgi:hypothetical protein
VGGQASTADVATTGEPAPAKPALAPGTYGEARTWVEKAGEAVAGAGGALLEAPAKIVAGVLMNSIGAPAAPLENDFARLATGGRVNQDAPAERLLDGVNLISCARMRGECAERSLCRRSRVLREGASAAVERLLVALGQVAEVPGALSDRAGLV